jgi:hypothetical protein
MISEPPDTAENLYESGTAANGSPLAAAIGFADGAKRSARLGFLEREELLCAGPRSHDTDCFPDHPPGIASRRPVARCSWTQTTQKYSSHSLLGHGTL